MSASLVGSEMCIRDRLDAGCHRARKFGAFHQGRQHTWPCRAFEFPQPPPQVRRTCPNCPPPHADLALNHSGHTVA
eukprot:14904288-Alexandrium_andersonii.AAC.1